MELEQVYNTIEDQQNMILDLVNNVVTDRERELKRKNNMLRQRIETLERSMAMEEAQRQEIMQKMPLKGIMKKMPKKVHYGEGYDDDSSSDEDDEDEEASDDDSGDSESETETDSRVE